MAAYTYDRIGYDRECRIELLQRNGWEEHGETTVPAGESLSAERKRIAALEGWPCWLVVLDDEPADDLGREL